MRDFILVQSICMLVPAVLVVGLCLALNCFLSKRRRISLSFDLLTLVLFVTVLGVVWPVGNWALDMPGFGGPSILLDLGLFSMFTVPFVWFLRNLIENVRRNRSQRLARKALTLQLPPAATKDVEKSPD